MFSQYFGHYLLNRNLITREQLIDALEYQKSVHVKFGVIAVDKGFMNSSQVDEVHEKQKQVDKRFGEIAIELGYLTEEQVEALVSHQKQGYLYLAQALVDRGYMTMDQFSNALNDYKKENSLSDEQFEAMQSGNVEAIIEHLLSINKEAKENFGNYISLFAKNLIRFIDDQIYFEVSNETTIESGNWLIYQTIEGEKPLFTGMNVNDSALVYIASKYAEEQLTEVDDLAKDSVCEFLNLHNGIHLVNMSNNGIELSMNPQKIVKDPKVTGELFIITVNISNHKFQFVLSSKLNEVVVEESSKSQINI